MAGRLSSFCDSDAEKDGTGGRGADVVALTGAFSLLDVCES